MYVDFFGLRELPFNNCPDPRFFFSTPDHEEALASLIYAVQSRKGFVLLTGEVGAGKTLVSRMMLRHFGGKVAFATINHALQNADDLMESLCAEFEIPFDPSTSNALLVRKLHDFLLDRFAQDTSAVLVLDEAQTVPVEAFEQLRMIGNLEADDAKLLQIVILGQPELQHRFASPELRQLRQRIFRVFHLPAMDRDTTEGYIRHRLQIAGASDPRVFDNAAIDVIHEHSQGLPRLVNTLCDNAMLSAYSADQPRVDAPLVENVVAQMMTLRRSRSSPASAKAVFAPSRSFESRAANPSSRETPEIQDADHSRREAHETRPERASYPGDPSYSYPPAGHCPLPAVPAPAAVAHEPAEAGYGLAQFRQAVADEVARMGRRVTVLEHDHAGLRETLDHARAVRDRLEPMLRGAADTIARADSSRAELADQQSQARKLAARIKAIVDESRRILDGIRQVADRSRRAERTAREASDRLASQIQRLREKGAAAAAPFDLNIQDASPDPADVPADPGQQAQPKGPTAPALLQATSRSAADLGADPDAFHRVLRKTRDSVCDFRSVALKRPPSKARGDSSADFTSRPVDDAFLDQPTARLAQEVEGLIDLITQNAN